MHRDRIAFARKARGRGNAADSGTNYQRATLCLHEHSFRLSFSRVRAVQARSNGQAFHNVFLRGLTLANMGIDLFAAPPQRTIARATPLFSRALT